MHKMQSNVVFTASDLHLFTKDGLIKVQLPQSDYEHDELSQTAGSITAPMNGTLVSMLVKPGDKVSKGAAIAIVEAMKMEHSLKAPFDAEVISCFFNAGERVDGGAILLELEALETE
jgi:3-methylcrotonyl-CoA carboxylase alpha subunit